MISTLVLTVELDCPRCDKKFKKILCKFPEIQSQIFDEKQNKVTISGPFDPEKLMKKLCCKACKYIKGHEIKKPELKPAHTKSNPPKTPPESPKGAPPVVKPPKTPPPPQKSSPPPLPPILPVPGIPIGPLWPRVCCRECSEGHEEQGICRRFGNDRPEPRVCCRECYEGHEEHGICRRLGNDRPGPRVCCRECYEGNEENGICRRFGYDSGYRFFSEEHLIRRRFGYDYECGYLGEENTSCSIM